MAYKTTRHKTGKNTYTTRTYNTKTGRTRTTYTTKPSKGHTYSVSTNKNGSYRQSRSYKDSSGFVHRTSKNKVNPVAKIKRIKNTTNSAYKNWNSVSRSRRSYNSGSADDGEWLILLIFGIFVVIKWIIKSPLLFWYMAKACIIKTPEEIGKFSYYARVFGLSLFYFYLFILAVYHIFK
jgi:hypothetical protein